MKYKNKIIGRDSTTDSVELVHFSRNSGLMCWSKFGRDSKKTAEILPILLILNEEIPPVELVHFFRNFRTIYGPKFGREDTRQLVLLKKLSQKVTVPV